MCDIGLFCPLKNGSVFCRIQDWRIGFLSCLLRICKKKLSTPIISIKDEHRSGKFITPSTKIGGGNLILSVIIGVSGGGLIGELADSVCASSSYRFAVMNILLDYLFGSGFGELRLEESDRFLLPVLVVHSGLWGGWTNHFQKSCNLYLW